MIRKELVSRDPDILGSFPALRRAARRARQLGRETNTPVYVIKKGRIVDLTEEAKQRRRNK